MRGKATPSQPARQPRPASSAEIEEAIKALTDEDTERIEQTALNRIARIRRSVNGRTHEDLIQEALIRILDGTRHWYKDQVEFTPYLIGVVWSIASEWAGHRKRNKDLPEYAATESALLTTDDEGKTVSPFDGFKDPRPNAEEATIEGEISAAHQAGAKVLTDRIEADFEGDEKASIILMGFQDGMDGPEIRLTFNMTEKEYRTTTRRIQRHARQIMDDHHGN